MVNDRHSLSCFLTVVARKKIARNELNPSTYIKSTECFVKTTKLAGGPNKTTQVAKAVAKKKFDNLGADKSVGSGHKDSLIRRCDVLGIQLLEPTFLLTCDPCSRIPRPAL